MMISEAIKNKTVLELWRSGDLNPLIEIGIIKTSVIAYCKIAEVYMNERRAGNSYTEAIQITCEKANASEATVKRAIAIVI
jgi:hypothetical protein